ncbi:MAG: hypothetical protein HON04_00130 [Planctomicrobium sp.]|jgi:hypothetical protein|nr:hypothetical protein [Planctomicrobium sp.]
MILFLSLFINLNCHAEEKAKLIFEDDFERNESQEEKDEIGNGWNSNSKSRANGNKQVDLKDGAMYIKFHPSADHAVSVTHPAEFTNGSVQLKFMLENKDDNLGLNFADLKFKEVHAGHLFMARIGTSRVELQDLKTGNMNLKTRELRLAKKLPKEKEEELKAKKKTIKNKLEAGKWHHLKVQVQGETMTLSINSKEVGEFTSEGIAHPTKRMLRLSVPKEAVVDEIKIYSTGS